MSYASTMALVNRRDSQVPRLRHAEHGEFQGLYNIITSGETLALKQLSPQYVIRLWKWLGDLPKQNPNWIIEVGEERMTISQIKKGTVR